MKTSTLIKRFRIQRPEHFRLADFDPADTAGLDPDKDAAQAILADDIAQLTDLQERLYAQHHWAVLVILQGMDAAGKDSVIKHVMSGLNPQGCEVHPFKAPSDAELDHDFLWRAAARLPERRRIGIFNRSYYEEVLAVRVHPELLARQKIPDGLLGKNLWQHRFKDIRAFERHLARNGVLVLKFFLHISTAEQRRRFLDRLEQPAKRWKFAMGDVAERALWDKYMAVYEEAIRATSRPHAPWYVVPADSKPFARLVVAAALIDALDRLGLEFPKIEGRALAEMQKARAALLHEQADGTRSTKSKAKRR
jgi:PPK2 family polyphosphate:nucleotide phosphotransferase